MSVRSPTSWLAALGALVLVGCVQAGLMSPSADPSVLHDTPATEPHATGGGSPYRLGGTCGTVASADRCQALAFAAAQELGVSFDAVVTIDVIPNPNAMDRSHPTSLSVALTDGSRHDLTITCPGIAAAFDTKCMPDPTVSLSFPGGGEVHLGYTDTPENATPFPLLDPAAVAAAEALVIPTLSVRILAPGPQAVVLGRATLPNGYLSEAQFALADPWPSNVLFNGSVVLEVKPSAGGQPLRNLYEHGWNPGVEEVVATLTFNVAWFQSGAELTLVDVVVR